MRPNSLRQKLDADEITVCTRIFNPEPMSVEVLGQTGQYDYVEFVAEYGSFHLHDLDNVCRAAELYGLGSMIKIDQSHQAFLAQRGIGAGFQAVLFTDCRSAEDVRECVRIARPDTPQHNGLYGAAARRNTPMGAGGSPAYVQAIRDTVVAVMIEKKGAVDELEEILSIPGLDMVQWGRYRLLHEHRPYRREGPSRRGGRAQTRVHQGAGARRRPARRDRLSRAGAGIPRHGRTPLLHRRRREHPRAVLDGDREPAPGGARRPGVSGVP